MRDGLGDGLPGAVLLLPFPLNFLAGLLVIPVMLVLGAIEAIREYHLRRYIGLGKHL